MADIEAQTDDLIDHQPVSTTANSQRLRPADIAAAQDTATTAIAQTTYPPPPHPPPPISQPPATNTNYRPHGNIPPPQVAGNQGVKYGDSSDAVWSMYLTEAEKEDKNVIESWKGDTEGILVFTGLFSATVATFIIESYQNLSPNSSDTTNALLGQITQQLVNISSGAPVISVATQINQPFKPTASAVRVNVLWFFSLVLSLTCALSATLMQQWARRYRELAEHHGAPHRRGRIRAYIFDGIRRFGMARAVATMPILLHISVFLFFAGLVDFLFPTDKTVSYFTLALVLAFTLAYAMLTVSPNLYLNCPYATPLSGVTWRLSQFFVIVGLKAALGFEVLFHNSVLKLWSRLNQHVTEPGVERWKEELKKKVKVHRQRLSDGLKRSIERNANDASSVVVPSALEWTLTALDEDKEIEKFATGVPGLFDSHTVPDATILTLMADKPLTDAIFGFRLYDLLKTCFLKTSPLKHDERESRLRVCLKCLWYFGRAYNEPTVSELLPSYFPSTLVSPEIIHHIRAEQDQVSRVMGHCFGALVVTKLAADISSRAAPNIPISARISDDELACLSTFLDAESRDVIFCLECPGAVELASMVSLALGSLDSLRNNQVTLDALILGRQTLAILAQKTELHLDQPIAQQSISDGKLDHIIVSPLLKLFHMCIVISATSPLTAEMRVICLQMCLKGLWYCAKAYHQHGASQLLPSHFPRTLASPEVIRHIQSEQDPVSRVMGRCFCALVVKKLAADVRSHSNSNSNVRIGDDELACLSIILGTKSDDIMSCLEWPGAVELASVVSLALGDLGSLDVSTLSSDGLNAAHQTLVILSQALPAEETAELQLSQPISQLNILNGEFDRTIVARLIRLLHMCFTMPGTSPLTTGARRGCLRMCLKSLWYCASQLGPSKQLPSYFLLDFATPEIIRHIQTEKDPVAHMIGRCLLALVVGKVASHIKSLADSDVQLRNKALACLSAILGTETGDLGVWVENPGTVELVNLVLLAFGGIGSVATDTVPSYVLDVIPQTFSISSQALPAEINTERESAQRDGKVDIPDGAALAMGEIYQNHSIRCLKSLWYRLQAYHQPGNSAHCPSYVLIAFASPVLTRHIHMEQGAATRVIGRCIEALVIKELVSGIKPSKNPNVIRDDKLAWLSAILCTETDDVEFCLECPGAIELVTMASIALGDVGSLTVNVLPSYVCDVAQNTLAILSQTAKLRLEQPIAQLNIFDEKLVDIIKSGLYNLLQMCRPGTLTATVRKSCLRMCLKSLWYCAKAYLQISASKPLPSYFPSILASTEITSFIRHEKDPVSRVVGCCFGALVVMKLVTDIRWRTDSGSNVQVSDVELKCLSAIFRIEQEREGLSATLMAGSSFYLEQPGAIEVVNIVLLASDYINFLAADAAVPSYALDVILQTFNILTQALPADSEINTKFGFDQMDPQVDIHRDEQSITQLNILAAKFHRIVVPSLHNVLQKCISGTSTLTAAMRENCLWMCLRGLFLFAEEYPQPDASRPFPSDFPRTLFVAIASLSPEVVHIIQNELDRDYRMAGRCFCALFVMKQVAGVSSRTDSNVQISNAELAWLSAILGIQSDDVKFCLELPGAVELAIMVRLILGDVGSLVDGYSVPRHVKSLANRTFVALYRALPAEMVARMKSHWDHDTHDDILDASESCRDGVVSCFHHLVQTCISGTSTLRTEVRRSCLRMCLKSRWYCVKAYPLHLPSYFLKTLASLEIIRRIQTVSDPVSRVMGRCFSAMVVMKLVANSANQSRYGGNQEKEWQSLEWLSTTLGTDRRDMQVSLEWPGAVELACLGCLTSDDIGPLDVNVLPSYLLDMTQEIRDILCRTNPDQPITQLNIWDESFGRMVASRLCDLLQTCVSGTSSPTAKVRRSCLRMCLYSLWYCAKEYHQLGASRPLPSYFPNSLATPEMIHLIQTEKDVDTGLTVRCLGALVATELVAVLNSRTDSNVQNTGDELACLSAILCTENHILRSWLGRPGVVELANLYSFTLNAIDMFLVNPSRSMMNMVHQTSKILIRTLLAEPNVGLMNFTDGTSPSMEAEARFFEIYESHKRLYVKTLWFCARACNQLGILVPLPSLVRIALSNPKFTQWIHAESDLATRVTGRCACALVVSNLVDDLQSRISFGNHVYNEELACISTLLGKAPGEFSRWPRPSAVIKLQNVVSLVSGDIEALFTSEKLPADVLHIVQQTLDIICSDLVLSGVFAGEDLPMDQVSLLREMCSEFANVRTNRFGDPTLEILRQLQRISQHLPTVEHKIRRCTSSNFDQKIVRRRGNLTTRPEYGVRRRSKSV